MKRQITMIGFFAVVFVFLSFGFTYIAHADEQERLDMKVDAGLKGKAKQQQGYPVTITVTNNKADFTGDLVVTLPVGNKVIPVDIAAGTTKTITFSVPAMREGATFRRGPNQKVQRFHLYEGNWENGEEVTIDSSLDLAPAYIPREKVVIGVLSDRPDSLNYIKLASFRGDSPEVIHLQASDLPEDATGLDVVDMLVINDYSVAKLPETTQAAMKNWVGEGGTLVTGSEPGLQQQFGELADILPLTVKGKETVQKVQGFKKLYQKPLQTDDFELFTGAIDEETRVLYKEDSLPLVAEKAFGKGVVIQAAFDLGLPVLADWKGSQPLWETIGSDSGSLNPQMMPINMQMNDQLTNMSRTFPTMANFKVSTLSFLFIAYLLLILPVLYIVLKKADKREWAWVVIPAIAVLSSVGLYTVGAKDRGGHVKTNTVSIISVDEQGIGSGDGSVSMLSKGAGAYTLTMDSELDPVAANNRYNPQQSANDLPFVEAQGKKTAINYRNVEFWSPRSAAIDYPVKKYGHFQSDLTRADDKISGQITNKFKHDLQDVYLISGRNYQKVGDLAAGKSKEVSFSAKSKGFYQAPTEGVAQQLFGRRGAVGQRNDQALQADLLSMAIRNNMQRNVHTPILIGFTDEALYPVTVNGDETVQNNLHLFTQPAAIQLPSNEKSTFSSEMNLPTISILDGQIFHDGMQQGAPFFDAESGSYLLTYELPASLREQTFQLQEIGITIANRRSNASFSLYNVESDTYEAIDQNKASFDQHAHESYVKDNAVVVRVNASGNGTVDVPAVHVKGVINP
ncbi:hypothetical protein EU245_10650 [Lentibacillus lipolyticus]|nr:hypothetical protein EU245_10650 [Lentibacillus lipolyticus]